MLQHRDQMTNDFLINVHLHLPMKNELEYAWRHVHRLTLNEERDQHLSLTYTITVQIKHNQNKQKRSKTVWGFIRFSCCKYMTLYQIHIHFIYLHRSPTSLSIHDFKS